MRPTYETESDVSKEKQIVDLVAARFGMTVVKLPKFKDIDFALMRGNVVWGVVEVKARGKHYPSMFLSLAKCQALRNYAAAGLQARVIFATPAGVFAKKIGPCEIDGWIGIGGRTDRNDPLDMEFVAHFYTPGQQTEEAEPMTKICDPDQGWFA